MDGERLKSDSDFLPNQCGRRVDGGVDRISQLPDEIKVVILSFLSLREAARTSTLSSRWIDLWKHNPDRISQLPDRIIVAILSSLPLMEAASTSVLSSRWLDLWKHTPYLDFSFRTWYKAKRNIPIEVVMSKYMEMVSSVLESHKALSLKKIRISVFESKSAKYTLIEWLDFVFSRQVESFELEVRWFEDSDQVALEELLRESRMCLQPQTDLIFFKSLKRLCLKILKVSGEAIELFLRNCPLLEQLIIRCADLTSDVDVCGATLMLKHLEISRCKGGKSIKLSAPNLTCISFDETSGRLLFENVPKLVEAKFIIHSPAFAVQHFGSAISCCFNSQLQVLVLFLYGPKMILANGFPEIPNLKKLDIVIDETYNHSLLPVVTTLIWASPRLEEFKLEFFGFDNDATVHMDVTTNVERFPHRHLKVFEFRRSCGDNSDHIIELVTYISGNCVALQKIIIGCLSGGPSEITAEEQSDSDYLKQQLRDKLPRHIQLLVSDLIGF